MVNIWPFYVHVLSCFSLAPYFMSMRLRLWKYEKEDNIEAVAHKHQYTCKAQLYTYCLYHQETSIHMNLTITLLLGPASADQLIMWSCWWLCHIWLIMAQKWLKLLKLTDLGDKRRMETYFLQYACNVPSFEDLKLLRVIWEPRCTSVIAKLVL